MILAEQKRIYVAKRSSLELGEARKIEKERGTENLPMQALLEVVCVVGKSTTQIVHEAAGESASSHESIRHRQR